MAEKDELKLNFVAMFEEDDLKKLQYTITRWIKYHKAVVINASITTEEYSTYTNYIAAVTYEE